MTTYEPTYTPLRVTRRQRIMESARRLAEAGTMSPAVAGLLQRLLSRVDEEGKRDG